MRHTIAVYQNRPPKFQVNERVSFEFLIRQLTSVDDKGGGLSVTHARDEWSLVLSTAPDYPFEWENMTQSTKEYQLTAMRKSKSKSITSVYNSNFAKHEKGLHLREAYQTLPAFTIFK